jgi:histidinol-phosphate aminotransferase
MPATMNRRDWLRRSALAGTALVWSHPSPAASPPEVRSFVKLDQNENPYGVSPKAEQAILAAIKSAHRYPGGALAALRDVIAEREQVPSQYVVLGAGCTEILSLACLLHGVEGKEVLVAEPTYVGFTSYVERCNGKLIRVPVSELFATDLEGMASQASRSLSLVYLCNPNNPTGTIVGADRLRQFIEHLPPRTVVLVDEAYYEFVEDSRRASLIALVRQGANVVVLRSFSKLYGLAGLRVGYGIAKPELATDLRRIQTNFAPLSQLSLAAARAVYADADWVARCRQRNTEARADFYSVLARLGYKAIADSQANFVTFEARKGAEPLVASLFREYAIGVRSFRFLGKSWVRASLGTQEEMSRLTAALTELA